MEAQGKGVVVTNLEVPRGRADLGLLNASTKVLVGNGKVVMFWISSWINNTSVVVMHILFFDNDRDFRSGRGSSSSPCPYRSRDFLSGPRGSSSSTSPRR
jgi:hypothetical protein